MAESHRSVTVMLPVSLIEAIDEACHARDVGRRWLIERLLAEGVERLIPVEELRLTRTARAVPVEPGERPRQMDIPEVRVSRARDTVDFSRHPMPRSAMKPVRDGVVHDVASVQLSDLWVQTACGMDLDEPWEWTEAPVSCAVCGP